MDGKGIIARSILAEHNRIDQVGACRTAFVEVDRGPISRLHANQVGPGIVRGGEAGEGIGLHARAGFIVAVILVETYRTVERVGDAVADHIAIDQAIRDLFGDLRTVVVNVDLQLDRFRSIRSIVIAIDRLQQDA